MSGEDTPILVCYVCIIPISFLSLVHVFLSTLNILFIRKAYDLLIQTTELPSMSKYR